MSFGIPVRNGLGVGLLASTSLSTRGGSFSPASLFASGEQGFYYDPSDFSTLYQDNAGTTPVTAVGQTVGLVLDKSRGLVLGPELVANGTFDSGTAGWTLTPGWTLDNGVIRRVAGQDPAGAVLSPVSGFIQSGKTYQVKWTRGGVANSSIKVRAYTASGGGGTLFYNPNYQNGIGEQTHIFTATNTGWIAFWCLSDSNVITIDNISVRELPGNHATQSVLASRPILQQDANGKFYLLFDGSDDFLVTPTITPGTDKAQVFAGVRTLSDLLAGMLIESGTNFNPSGIAIYNNTSTQYSLQGHSGTGFMGYKTSGITKPATSVLSMGYDIAASGSRDAEALFTRVNGATDRAATEGPWAEGSGDFASNPLYIGRRGGTTFPFNGRLYGLIARFGPNLSDVQIAQTEQWLNQKTGAY